MRKFLYSLLSALLLAVIVTCGFTISALAAGYQMQDIENPVFPTAGWTVQNTSGYNMVRTTYCSGYGTGTASIVVDFYDYASGNFELISPTLPAASGNDSLVFDHAYASATGAENDNLVLYTSTNNGTSWTLLATLNGGSSGELVTATPRYNLFVPNSSQWATKRYLLPTGTNKVKFTANTQFGNNLYLDNIRIGTRYANDVGVNSISDPKWGITTGSKIPKAWVRNYGTASQSFSVTMTINPGGYTNTQSVTGLAPGAAQQLTFTSFNFATTGTYTIKAYSTLAGDQNMSNDTTTNALTVTLAPRKVVLEFCTGTWCQWCPCGDIEARNLELAYPDNTVILAYHGASTDPWKNFNGNSIISLLGFTGYPSGLVDRRLGLNSGWGSFYFDGEYRISSSPSATVNLATTNVTYNTGNRQLTVNMNATALTTLSGQYKVNYVITEDNLVYPQTGNSWCPGSSTWVHHWVVRNMVNGATGDNVNSGTWNSGQTYPLTFTTTLDAAWQPGNCKFDVFIYKDNGALNVSETQGGFESGYIITGINSNGQEIPKTYELEQNYPNPFNPVTNVHFAVPKDGEVSLTIYNALGQKVATYLDGFIKAGNYNAEIDASEWASGVYFYTLSAKDFIQTKKMILVK